MSVSSVTSTTPPWIQALIEQRNQLIDLQRQLGTGKKADSYAGLGLDRSLTVGLRAHLSAISGYQQTITQVGVRLDIAQTALTQMSGIAQSAKTTVMTSQYVLNGENLTLDQKTVRSQLDQMLSLLNTSSGDRYLFSGRSVDKPAVETSDHILEGDGVRAGLKQVIAERKLADLGADGFGRLVLSAPSATAVAVAEDAVSPFGLKLAGVSSTLTGATVSGPSGSPAAASIDLGATNPNVGEVVKFSFVLPDGSHQDISLTATAASPPGANRFSIGATSDVTATNLKAALTQALGSLGRTALTAASAVAAGNDFFNADGANPPQRVAGPPFESATALVDGTPADTVVWYTGDDDPDSARATSVANVDHSLAVSYGMRASEQALRLTVRHLAVFAAVTYSAIDPDGEASYAALRQRIGAALAGQSGQQKISDIAAELAGVQSALAAAKDRHQQTDTTLQGLLQNLEGAPTEEVAAKILALQTSLQASLQTSAMLLQTNLLKYL
jgi:flagellar hook-associated protein 3 FlgL